MCVNSSHVCIHNVPFLFKPCNNKSFKPVIYYKAFIVLIKLDVISLLSEHNVQLNSTQVIQQTFNVNIE